MCSTVFTPANMTGKTTKTYFILSRLTLMLAFLKGEPTIPSHRLRQNSMKADFINLIPCIRQIETDWLDACYSGDIFCKVVIPGNVNIIITDTTTIADWFACIFKISSLSDTVPPSKCFQCCFSRNITIVKCECSVNTII